MQEVEGRKNAEDTQVAVHSTQVAVHDQYLEAASSGPPGGSASSASRGVSRMRSAWKCLSALHSLLGSAWQGSHMLFSSASMVLAVCT